jgi:hypothetical protein
MNDVYGLNLLQKPVNKGFKKRPSCSVSTLRSHIAGSEPTIVEDHRKVYKKLA